MTDLVCCECMQRYTVKRVQHCNDFRHRCKICRDRRNSKIGKTRPRSVAYRERQYLLERCRRYNINLDQLQVLLERTKGLCTICKERPNNPPLNIDHDHKTGRVRGLLCSDCNKGLGNFRDSPALLLNAVEYLQNSGI